MDRLSSDGWRIALGAVAVLVFGFFLYSLRAEIGPFIWFLALVGVLLPFRGMPGHTAVVSVAALLILYWVLDTTGFLLAPFVLALVLAYVLDPLVDRLEARGLTRSISIVVLAFPVATIGVLAVVFGVPSLVQQLAEVTQRVPELLQRLGDWVEGLDQRLGALALPTFLDAWVQDIRTLDPDALVDILQQRQTQIADAVRSGVLGLGRGVGSALTILGYVVLTPVLTFYLLRDWDGLTEALKGVVPPARRDDVVGFFSEYDGLLSSYLRGQVTVALIIGTITAVGLFIANIPFALLLGAIVAVFSVVPYVGLLVSLVPAIAVAIVSPPVGWSLLKVALVFGAAQGLEGTVISPRIVGESVGLHPVWIVLALAVGGYFFGFVGLLIGVPLAVGIKLIAIRGLASYRESAIYTGGPGVESS